MSLNKCILLLKKIKEQIFAKCKNKYAFSLAEILMCLLVLAMVAVMTIAIVRAMIGDYLYKVRYQKAYSIAVDVWAKAVNENAMVFRPTWGDDSSRVANFETFKSYFMVSKDCTHTLNIECWADAESYKGHPLPQSMTPSFIDSSGVAWSLEAEHNSGGEILVDTNNFKGPNQYGIDRFVIQSLMSDKSMAGGIPTVIVPFPDILSKNGSICPSGNSHPCYYSSWLFGDESSSSATTSTGTSGSGSNGGGSNGNGNSGGNNGNGKNK